MDIYTIDQLLKSGNWMIRFDNDGVSYDGFKWADIGAWTIAPDWDPTPECGHGLHGQSPMGAGFSTRGSRMVLCETEGQQVKIGSDKIKVRAARIIAVKSDIPLEFLTALAQVGGSLYLEGYNHPLPASLAQVGGSLYLEGYNHPLPASLAKRETRRKFKVE